MTRQEIIADLDRQIEDHLDTIRRAAESGNNTLLEKAIKNATGPLNGLWQARAIVTKLPEN